MIFLFGKDKIFFIFAKKIIDMKVFLKILLLMALPLTALCQAGDSTSRSTDDAIREMCQHIHNQYPLATLQDIYKTCYQDFFGAEHLMSDTAAARYYIHQELEQCRDTDLSLIPKCEPTGYRHRFVRINFSNILERQLSEEQLVMMFIDAAGKDNAFSDDWLSEWKNIETIALEVNPGWADAELQSELTIAAENSHAVRHSEAFRENYNPHYRIVRNNGL